MKSGIEISKKVAKRRQCSRCGEKGHYRTRCHMLNTDQDSNNATSLGELLANIFFSEFLAFIFYTFILLVGTP